LVALFRELKPRRGDGGAKPRAEVYFEHG
jgi:hypothetical protein